MVQVIAGHAADRELDPRALHGMYRLRNSVFHERLGWDVTSRGGLERDEYDEFDPVYLIAREPSRHVSGCMRLLPTTGSYMLRDTFPELLRGEEEPCDEKVWDVSRFAVASAGDATPGHAGSSEITLELVRAAVDYAFEHGIEAYVAVVSLGLERIFRRIGLPVRRFGDGKSARIGDVRAVACRIEMNEEARRSVRRTVRRAA